MAFTFRRIETDDRSRVPTRIAFQGERYRLHRLTNKNIDTRFGPISLQRWFYQADTTGVPGIAPLHMGHFLVFEWTALCVTLNANVPGIS